MQLIQNLNKVRFMNLLFAAMAIFALTFVAACDEPTAGEKIENAADEFGDGVEDAAEEMQDRSTGEKIGDAIEDTGEEMQEMAE
jgi:hypothetical protein